MGAEKIESQENSVRRQLADFGLNPFEWQILNRRANTYQNSHREDPGFRMNVYVRALRTGLVRVDQLSVVSL
jgi:hypothetical protein